MKDFTSEIVITTARSGGSGGQHVNKVETMAIAHWQVMASAHFTEEEKQRICTRLAKSINKEGKLVMKSNRARTQLENRSIVLQKMLATVLAAILPEQKRKATQVPAFVRRKRKEDKMRRSQKKQWRSQDW